MRVTAQLFDDIQSAVESKQLQPMLRTQARHRQRSGPGFRHLQLEVIICNT